MIILASKSPRRKELLKILNLKFKVVESDFEEDFSLEYKPLKLIKYFSSGKANAVFQKHQNDLIISADTFIVFNNEIIGKPKNKKDASMMLKKFSGHKLTVMTAFTVKNKIKQVTKVVRTKISFRKISDIDIKKYINTKEPLDKAGAFAVQGVGAIFIKKINGDFFNIVGLPISELKIVLESEFNIKIW